MAVSDRQDQLNELVKAAIEKDANLQRALDIFDMSQIEYLHAVSGLRNTTISTTSGSNPGKQFYAESSSHARGD